MTVSSGVSVTTGGGVAGLCVGLAAMPYWSSQYSVAGPAMPSTVSLGSMA